MIQQHEQTRTPAELAETKKPHGRKFRAKKLLIIIALIALLTGAAVGGFYLWQQLQHVGAQISGLQKDLSRTNMSLAQQETLLQAEQRNLQALIQQNQQREGGRILVEVSYLVRLAAFHLAFENNIVVARQLLAAADFWIAADGSPALWPLRQVLAQDMAMLEATPTVDLPGLLARIGALSQQAEGLPELPIPVLQKKADVPALDVSPLPPINSISDKLKHFAVAMGDALSKMVIVSNDNTKLAPSLLTTEQRIYIVTNIQSQLTLAQWAAVHRQENIYTQSLVQVENWLQHYFSNDMPLVQGMLKTVADLKTISVNPSTPEISRSLDALQKINHLKNAEG